MKRYVCGVIFSNDLRMMVLMEKKRPKWQAGKLNFPGGAVEPQDGVEQNTLTREVFEELGLKVPASRWTMFAKLTTPDTDSDVYFGAIRLPQGEAETVQTMTDEQVFLVDVSTVSPAQIAEGWPMPEKGRYGRRAVGTPLYNIAWLTSLARTVLLGDDCQYIIGEVRTTPGPARVT